MKLSPYMVPGSDGALGLSRCLIRKSAHTLNACTGLLCAFAFSCAQCMALYEAAQVLACAPARAPDSKHMPLNLVMGIKHTLLVVGAGGLGIRTRVTRRSQAQPGDRGRLDTSEFFEQVRRPTLALLGVNSRRWECRSGSSLACAVPGCKPIHSSCGHTLCTFLGLLSLQMTYMPA